MRVLPYSTLINGMSDAGRSVLVLLEPAAWIYPILRRSQFLLQIIAQRG